jgi:hypothetical protein
MIECRRDMQFLEGMKLDISRVLHAIMMARWRRLRQGRVTEEFVEK